MSQQPPARVGNRYQTALEGYLAALAELPPAVDAPKRPVEHLRVTDVPVGDVMTSTVVCVSATTPFKAIVDCLARRHVSAVPVIDSERRVLGIVTESDLISRIVGRDGVGSTRRHHRTSSVDLHHPTTAAHVMSTPVVTVQPDESAVDAARLAARARVRRLPVVDDEGRLVGIVTRADLLKVFVLSDVTVRSHVIDRLEAEVCIDASTLRIVVVDGVVTVSGQAESAGVADEILEICRTTAGVIDVRHDLSIRQPEAVASPYKGMFG